MREINRKVVAAVIFSKDKKLFQVKKDPKKGGVYPDYWHIPGGGVEAGESNEEALIREIKEETGIDYKVVISDKLAKDIKVSLGDELEAYAWIDTKELKGRKVTPPSEKLFKKLGYIK